MSIEPKNVTDGYWFVKNSANEREYSIVHVYQGEIDCVGTTRSFNVYERAFEFIAPVPAVTEVADISPDAAREEMVKLRQALNLPVHASVTEVFAQRLLLQNRLLKSTGKRIHENIYGRY